MAGGAHLPRGRRARPPRPGLSNRQIADRLVITPKTAANHIAHVYTKIDVSSRAAATLFASRHGLVGAFETDASPDHGT